MEEGTETKQITWMLNPCPALSYLTEMPHSPQSKNSISIEKKNHAPAEEGGSHPRNCKLLLKGTHAVAAMQGKARQKARLPATDLSCSPVGYTQQLGGQATSYPWPPPQHPMASPQELMTTSS